MTKINRLLKEDLDAVVKRNAFIDQMTMFGDGYGISKGPQDQVVDNVIAAQSADAMLTIKDVEASFVIYLREQDKDHQIVGVSARSLGNINVQTIMERMGGGGHLSNAATQIKDKTIDEVYDDLIESIKFDMEE